MEKPIIVIKLTFKQYQQLVSLANRVTGNMTGNLSFPTPNPALASLTTQTTAVLNAIAAWGPKGNRGSHSDLVNLRTQSKTLLLMLTALAEYCMNVVSPTLTLEEQTAILTSSGYTIKNPKTTQGVLQMVQNFHQFVSRKTNTNQIKLKWKQPLGLNSKRNVQNYKVFRNTSNNFATATLINSVGITSYIDTPATGTWYYWVVATNNKGDGVVSNVITYSTPVAS